MFNHSFTGVTGNKDGLAAIDGSSHTALSDGQLSFSANLLLQNYQ